MKLALLLLSTAALCVGCLGGPASLSYNPQAHTLVLSSADTNGNVGHVIITRTNGQLQLSLTTGSNIVVRSVPKSP